MFGNRKIKELEKLVKELSKRVVTLEEDCRPFMVGPEPEYWHHSMKVYDTRTRVSLHDAARKIMLHCGLRFERTPITGGEIVVKGEGK